LTVDLRGEPNLPRFSWLIEQRLAGMAAPRGAETFTALHERGVRAVMSLTEWPLPDGLFARYGLHTSHLPLADFTAPTVEQAATAVGTINRFLVANEPVVVHCEGGMGRTGTILACYLVSQGATAADAVAEIRTRRPGSIETAEQEASVAAYECYLREQSAR